MLDNNVSTCYEPYIYNYGEWIQVNFPEDVEIYTIFLLLDCINCQPAISFDVTAGNTLCAQNIVPDGVFSCS